MNNVKPKFNFIRLIPTLLSLTAGSVDVISFLALNGLFVSHITGNLVILAVRIVDVGEAPLALVLSIPIFVFVLALTKYCAHKLENADYNTLKILLLIQFLFLLGYLLIGINLHKPIHSTTLLAVLAGMLGVSAMAVQNALVQISLKGVSATAVMTTNVTRFVMDSMEVFIHKHSPEAVDAKKRALNILPVIIGFIIGCAAGALLEAHFGLFALLLSVTTGFLSLLCGLL